ncbi:lipopolysaccharide assembly protein LapA domain-containing protein [Thiohalorhabdus sp. Cl-TMA]|uniref:Lipopolysaccharide assembly protein LapA domain-containing protein n=1 Tax=Thiohalorhabdus methylotrophus TaxID=3242694 RepID=A0ABV4TV05_9GAMM
MYYKLLLALVLLILVLIFVLQNTTIVDINFLVWKFTLSRGLLVLIVLLVGMLIGWLGRAQMAHRNRKRHRL